MTYDEYKRQIALIQEEATHRYAQLRERLFAPIADLIECELHHNKRYNIKKIAKKYGLPEQLLGKYLRSRGYSYGSFNKVEND